MGGLLVRLRRMFTVRPHFRRVGVSARHHTAEEAPLVEEVLLGDFMGVEEDFVEAEAQEVTAKLHGLFPIHSFWKVGISWKEE